MDSSLGRQLNFAIIVDSFVTTVPWLLLSILSPPLLFHVVDHRLLKRHSRKTSMEWQHWLEGSVQFKMGICKLGDLKCTWRHFVKNILNSQPVKKLLQGFCYMVWHVVTWITCLFVLHNGLLLPAPWYHPFFLKNEQIHVLRSLQPENV